MISKNSLFILLISCISGLIQTSCDSPASQNTSAVQQESREPRTETKSDEKPAMPALKRKATVTAKQEVNAAVSSTEQELLPDSVDQPAEESQDLAVGWDAEREELRKNVKAEMEAIETKIDEIKGEIDGAGPDVRTRCQRAISELRYERAKLNTQLKAISAAKKDNWDRVKNRINNAIQATDERVSQVAEQVAR